MKKIITAINNPNLNEKLKQENNLEIIYTGSKAVATVKWREVWV